ncbi:hypothetical protein ACQQ9V_07715 [Hornefia butyriciproducens]|uniref:hypothetical protein n=1 Tax=Hornefia butyriciproducens TaxID=2652293 RepID=UPI003D07F8E8
MNQQKGRIAELLPKQSGRELSYIIFFAQIVIIAAILCVTFTDVGAEKLTGLILVLALASDSVKIFSQIQFQPSDSW